MLGHRSCGDYIATVVIGLGRGPAAPDLGTVWRWFGHHGGPAVLNVVLGTRRGAVANARPDDFAGGQLGDELLAKLAVAALTLPVDAETAPQVLGLYGRLLASERKAREREEAPGAGAILPNVRAMWRGLPAALKADLE